MTAPRPGYEWRATGQASLLLRVLAVACVVAILIAGFLILDKITADRVATGLIASGVLGGVLILI